MRKNLGKISAITMALVIATSTLMPVMAQSGYSSEDTTNTEAVQDALTNSDIIDYSKTGSLTIRKYDMTAAETNGKLSSINTENTDYSSGEQNTTAEKTFADYEVKGVEFTYVNLGKIETSSKIVSGKNETKVVYEIDSELRGILGLNDVTPEDMTASSEANKCSSGKYHYTASVLQSALKTTNASGVTAKDKLEAYAVKNGTAMNLTDENGLTKAEKLALGLYLVVETKVPEQVTSTVDPWIISIPMTHSDGGSWFYDVYAYPKNQTGNPTLDKFVRNATGKNVTDASKTAEDNTYIITEKSTDNYASSRTEYTYASSVTASEGDILDYILVSKLPHITSSSTYLTQYKFVDTLSKGIEYVSDTVQIAFYAKSDDAMVNDVTKAAAIWNVASKSKSATITTTDTKTDSSTLTVDITSDGLKDINKNYSDYYIVVYYQAKVNSDATAVLGDAGNPNDVQLTWKRTSTGYYDTLEDKATVFTYGLDVTKTFSDSNGNAENVKFTLYNTTDGYYVTSTATETVGNNKIYYVTGKTAKESEATQFIPNKNGKLLIYGLEGDKYELTEIATDKKYSLLKDPVVVDITTATQDFTASVAGWDGLTLNDADKVNTTSGDGRPAGKTAMAEGKVTSGTATVDGQKVALAAYDSSNNGVAGISVLNSKNWIIPATGGYGIRILPIIGLIVAGAGLLFMRRKNEEKA